MTDTPWPLAASDRAWRPIEAMALSQIKTNDISGAVTVFKAADQPGWHQDHLRKKCLELTGVDLAGLDDRTP